MILGGLGQPWVTLKRLMKLLALSQLVSPLVACLAVFAASSSIRATTVDSPSTDTLHSSTLPPMQQEVTRRGEEESQCCTHDQGGKGRCPRDYPTPSPTQVVRECNDPATPCSALPLVCLMCSCDYSCAYGKVSNASCTLREGAQCSGERDMIVRQFTCSYCYLTDPAKHQCKTRDLGCRSVGSPTSHHHWYVANCTSGPDTLCLGKQVFSKRMECNWTEGYSWKTALILSITLGGFGADRFYLGHWQEGIGKLFSFGGLGVWTLVDVVLVSIGYIGPADGSLYI